MSESPGPPVIWPRLGRMMPSPNAGARGAPITNVVATTTGRDANKSSPDEGRGPPLGRRPQRPDDTNQADHRILDAGGPDHMVRRHVVTTMRSSAAAPRAAEGPLQQSSRRRRPRDRKRGIAVTLSRDAARSHSRGRTRGDGGCWTGALARYRLAPRRREMTFGRRSDSGLAAPRRTKAIAARGGDQGFHATRRHPRRAVRRLSVGP